MIIGEKKGGQKDMPANTVSVAFFSPLQHYKTRRLHQT